MKKILVLYCMAMGSFAVCEDPFTVLNCEKIVVSQNLGSFAITRDNVNGPIKVKVYSEINVYPLVCAVAMGNNAEAQQFLEMGADIEQVTPSGATPLTAAIGALNVPGVSMLLSYGANVQAINTQGENVLAELSKVSCNDQAFLTYRGVAKSDCECLKEQMLTLLLEAQKSAQDH